MDVKLLCIDVRVRHILIHKHKTFIENIKLWFTMLNGSLSPRQDAPSVSGWRRRPPDMKGSCEYV